MQVLIVKTSAFGDIVHAAPVVSYLHGACPGIEIDWLLEKPFAPLLEGHPEIRRVHRVDTKLWRQPGNLVSAAVDIHRTLRLLRHARYDVVLDLQGNSKSGLFTLASGAPQRYGFDRSEAREWPNLLATNRRVSISDGDLHITERALKVAENAFPAAPMCASSGTLKADQRAIAAVKKKLSGSPYSSKSLVLIHPGTTWKTKCISTRFWMQLAATLVRSNSLQLLFTWGNRRELKQVGEITKGFTERIVVWPQVDIKELMALISQVDLVIGGDTGPVHLAAALGTSTLSFYRATASWRNGPRGANHITFQSSMECSPCLLKNCPQNDHCSSMNFQVQNAEEAVYNLLNKQQEEHIST